MILDVEVVLEGIPENTPSLFPFHMFNFSLCFTFYGFSTYLIFATYGFKLKHCLLSDASLVLLNLPF